MKSKNLQKLESEVNRLYDRLQSSHAERDRYKAALEEIMKEFSEGYDQCII